MVGVPGFEPEASWSRTKRDTKLRHTPFFQSLKIIWHNEGFVKCFICLLREYFMNFRCFPLSDDKMPSAKLTDYSTKYRSCYNTRNLSPYIDKQRLILLK